MEIYSTIFSIIIGLLILWFLISIIRDSKAFFVDIPLVILKSVIGWNLIEPLFNKGEKAEKSNVIFEFFFALLTFPVMLPLLFLPKK